MERERDKITMLRNLDRYCLLKFLTDKLTLSFEGQMSNGSDEDFDIVRNGIGEIHFKRGETGGRGERGEGRDEEAEEKGER